MGSVRKRFRFGNAITRIGLVLFALIAGLAALSYGFPYGALIRETPLLIYISIALIAGFLWCALGLQLENPALKSTSLVSVLVIGLAMRGAMFLSQPVLEDDSYRYLWDGAVTANGIDPYVYAPADAAPDPVLGDIEARVESSDLRKLRALAEANETAHQRINYPYIATIYPPLTQLAFAAAHFIDPFGLMGWRLILLLADLATFVLLIRLLRAYDRDRKLVCLYWWNPVVIVQGFGAGHMDLLLLPFLLLTLLSARQKRLGVSTLFLAASAAVKIWPALLFPLLVRPVLSKPVRLALLATLFAGSTLLLLWPQLWHVLRPEAGLNAYAVEWRTHAFLFSILEDVVFAAFEEPGQVARVFVALVTISLTLYLALKFGQTSDRLPILVGIVIAGLIFLSPTGYPWYFIWLAPFVAFLPHRAFLCLFALAPLYWLRFQLGDQSILYQWGVVPIAFGTPLLLLIPNSIWRGSYDAFRDNHPRLK